MKTKIENKIKNGNSPEKILLEIFKYYDVNNSEKVNKETFEKVVSIKLNLNLFS